MHCVVLVERETPAEKIAQFEARLNEVASQRIVDGPPNCSKRPVLLVEACPTQRPYTDDGDVRLVIDHFDSASPWWIETVDALMREIRTLYDGRRGVVVLRISGQAQRIPPLQQAA